jgi:hypothetical protein
MASNPDFVEPTQPTLMKTETFLRITSVLMIIAIAFPLSAGARDRLLGTKTTGKLAMIAILSVTAFVIKMLIDRDRKELAGLREKLGPPDRAIEFQEGFDHWRVEWYGDRVCVFRNGVLYKQK